jgi:DNA ligase-associated metallophosphoesterase
MACLSSGQSDIPAGVRVSIAGEDVVLLASRTVYWPERSTLLVADVHLGKVETFGAHGVALPDGLALQPLATLADTVRETGAQRVLVLGDLLHAGLGLTPSLVERVRAWIGISGVRVAITPGNHDRALARVGDAWGLEVLATVHDEGPFRFAHDPQDLALGPGGARFGWCGHVHPVVRLRSASDGLRLACFWMRGRGAGTVQESIGGTCVLPAFNIFTGGATIAPSPRDAVYAIAEGRVVELAPAGAAPPGAPRDEARATARRIRAS